MIPRIIALAGALISAIIFTFTVYSIASEYRIYTKYQEENVTGK